MCHEVHGTQDARHMAHKTDTTHARHMCYDTQDVRQKGGMRGTEHKTNMTHARHMGHETEHKMQDTWQTRQT